jgi:hypothetical protein
MRPAEADALRPLEALLRALCQAGRRGDKAADGVLHGDALPRLSAEGSAPTNPAPPAEPTARLPALDPALFRALFVNRCLRAVEADEIGRPSLEAILDGIYGGVAPFTRAIEREADSMRALLEALFARTGRWYCSPASSLRASGP